MNNRGDIIKIKILILLILFLLLPIKAKAVYEVTDPRCTMDLKMELRDKSLELTYNYLKTIEKSVVTYKVTLYNIDDNIYVIDSSTNKEYTKKSNIITNIKPGTNIKLYVYANNTYCNDYRIKTITIQIPYYNKYSTNKLCEGHESYSLCNETANINITEDEFEKRMKAYIESLNTKEQVINKKEEQEIVKTKMTFFDFIIKYNKYISASGVLLLIIYIIIVIKNVNKKRGIL